jgi:hypothetical protein
LSGPKLACGTIAELSWSATAKRRLIIKARILLPNRDFSRPLKPFLTRIAAIYLGKQLAVRRDADNGMWGDL